MDDRSLTSANKAQLGHRLSDVVWGIKQALLLTGIALVPASVVFVGRSTRGGATPREPLLFGRVLLLYCGMAVAGGVVLGWCRPALRSRVGAIVVGAAVGTTAFTILLWHTEADPRDVLQVRALGALLGAVVGMMLGAHYWRKFGQPR